MKRFFYSLIILVLAGISPAGAGQMMLLGAGTGVPPTPLLIDTLAATASHAYSSRKIRAAYAGFAMRVQRTSDNTTQDIGFSSGDLDTTALATFCGVSVCGVSIWYDQVGSTNCTQGTQASQGRVTNAGTNDVLNSHVAVRWGGISANTYCLVTQSLLAQPNTIAMAAKFVTIVSGTAMTDGNTTTPRNIIGTTGTTQYQLYAGTVLNGGTPDTTTTHAFIGIFNGASSSLVQDGSSIISGNANTLGLNNFIIGGTKGGGAQVGQNFLDGEFIVFNSAISGGDQTLIRTSWQSYWGTP